MCVCWAAGVDHPLCLDCSAQLKEAVTGQIAEVEREIAAYSAAAAKLAREQQEPLSEVRAGGGGGVGVGVCV